MNKKLTIAIIISLLVIILMWVFFPYPKCSTYGKGNIQITSCDCFGYETKLGEFPNFNIVGGITRCKGIRTNCYNVDFQFNNNTNIWEIISKTKMNCS
jgi:hypothetical protein